jgi:hypothetical protein
MATAVSTAIALYHRIPVVPSDRYYFVRRKCIRFENEVRSSRIMRPIDFEYLHEIVNPLYELFDSAVQEDMELFDSDCILSILEPFKIFCDKGIVHYTVKPKNNDEFNMIDFIKNFPRSNIFKVLPCLKCSFFKWTPSFGFFVPSYVFHMVEFQPTSPFVYFHDGNQTLDLVRWQLKTLWYQDYYRLDLFLSWLPEEILHDILNNFLTTKKDDDYDYIPSSEFSPMTLLPFSPSLYYAN